MIRIVGTPAECKLAEVARSDDEAAELAGIVHKHLSSLTSLNVFIGDIKLIRRMTYITAMQGTGFFNIYLHSVNAESLHKLPSI